MIPNVARANPPKCQRSNKLPGGFGSRAPGGSSKQKLQRLRRRARVLDAGLTTQCRQMTFSETWLMYADVQLLVPRVS